MTPCDILREQELTRRLRLVVGGALLFVGMLLAAVVATTPTRYEVVIQDGPPPLAPSALSATTPGGDLTDPSRLW